MPKKRPPSPTAKRKRHSNIALDAAQITALLSRLDSVHDDALLRLGLSTGMRVSEITNIRTSEIDWERGLIKIWDEKKDRWRHVMPTMETIHVLRRYVNNHGRPPQYLFELSAKTVERIIQRASRQSIGRAISWHSVRHTYISRSVELEQSPAVVVMNTGDSPATILRYYTHLPEPVARRFVESKPVIPAEKV